MPRSDVGEGPEEQVGGGVCLHGGAYTHPPSLTTGHMGTGPHGVPARRSPPFLALDT